MQLRAEWLVSVKDDSNEAFIFPITIRSAVPSRIHAANWSQL